MIGVECIGFIYIIMNCNIIMLVYCIGVLIGWLNILFKLIVSGVVM